MNKERYNDPTADYAIGNVIREEKRKMNKPLRPCRHPGCNNLTNSGYCDLHRSDKREQESYNDSKRPSAYKRGYDGKWKKASESYLAHNPLCVECYKKGIIKAATDVDHIKPHRGNSKLFWDKNNWQGLCHECHSRKTAREDNGGWY